MTTEKYDVHVTPFTDRAVGRCSQLRHNGVEIVYAEDCREIERQMRVYFHTIERMRELCQTCPSDERRDHRAATVAVGASKTP